MLAAPAPALDVGPHVDCCAVYEDQVAATFSFLFVLQISLLLSPDSFLVVKLREAHSQNPMRY